MFLLGFCGGSGHAYYVCDLSPERVSNLVLESPYNVKDVDCSSKHPWTYRLTIENYGKEKRERSIASVQVERELKTLGDKLVNEKKGNQTKHSLQVGSFYGAASLAATDKASKATEKSASDIGYGAHVVWGHKWSENLNYFFVGTLRKFNFKTSLGRFIEKSSVSQAYVGTGLNVRITERLRLIPGVGLGQSLLLTSDGSSKLEIKKITIPAASLGISFDLLKFESGFNLSAKLRAGGLIPTRENGVATEFGHYQAIGLSSNFGAFGQSLNISTTYTQRSLETESLNQRSSELGVIIGIGWEF